MLQAWSAQAHDDAAVRGELERAQEAAAYLCTQLQVARTAAAAGRDQVDQCKDGIESCAKEARYCSCLNALTNRGFRLLYSSDRKPLRAGARCMWADVGSANCDQRLSPNALKAKTKFFFVFW